MGQIITPEEFSSPAHSSSTTSLFTKLHCRVLLLRETCSGNRKQLVAEGSQSYLHGFLGKSVHLPAIKDIQMLLPFLRLTGRRGKLACQSLRERSTYPFQAFMHERVSSRHFSPQNGKAPSDGFPWKKRQAFQCCFCCFVGEKAKCIFHDGRKGGKGLVRQNLEESREQLWSLWNWLRTAD